MTYADYCKNELDYEVKTTFFEDFTIAEMFGVESIINTFDNAFAEWKNDIVYLTELVMVLNHKMFMYHGENEEFADLYYKLWVQADTWGCEHFTGADAEYYYRTLD